MKCEPNAEKLKKQSVNFSLKRPVYDKKFCKNGMIYTYFKSLKHNDDFNISLNLTGNVEQIPSARRKPRKKHALLGCKRWLN